ncbi:1-phosphofructokinase family hexose kinase [Teichococcus vastitatis]|uniref:Phosphofructokinase n=1 Tax=Teichococcus vastitatis TaxID=2307076 RepID=A0ABS9W9I0_9PROT|nr:1-phosphofructokinase family hexose kinase [Pseudoroseomonas vastitatis]MCI0755954.1 1-phosphofructokinase family hexose kinase [Pseudoroseomonas vastitatis]
MPPRITTLTLNPTIDLASEADTVHPVRKIRTRAERQDPGGGGVNVARVVRELGGDTLAIILAGGVTGGFLEQLLEEAGVPCRSVPVVGRTRISQTVLERSTGLEYRFVAEGPQLSEAEWHSALDAADEVRDGWLVASGSLPPGVPADFYARLTARAARHGTRLVLDTSGEALQLALQQGGLELVKPSIGEFERAIGRKLSDPAAQEAAAMELVQAGKARLVAVTMGGDGALLARAEGVLRLPALPVEVRGAVGAGDSFVAAMVMALADGRGADDAFAWGVAAGAAAVSQAGTAHPARDDVIRLRRKVAVPMEQPA